MHSRMCKFNYECMSVFPYGSPIAIEFEDPSSDDVIVEVAAPNDTVPQEESAASAPGVEQSAEPTSAAGVEARVNRLFMLAMVRCKFCLSNNWANLSPLDPPTSIPSQTPSTMSPVHETKKHIDRARILPQEEGIHEEEEEKTLERKAWYITSTLPPHRFICRSGFEHNLLR